MTETTKKNLRAFWEIKLKEWQSTNLNSKDWCKQNQVTYGQLKYWKKTLLTAKTSSYDIPMSPEHFVELKDSQQDNEKAETSEIKVTWHHVTIHLPQKFNKDSLKNILEVMKEIEAC